MIIIPTRNRIAFGTRDLSPTKKEQNLIFALLIKNISFDECFKLFLLYDAKVSVSVISFDKAIFKKKKNHCGRTFIFTTLSS